MDAHPALFLGGWTAAHALAIAIALLCRMSLGPRSQALLQLALPVGIVLVAGLALATDGTAPLAWVISAGTLGLMVVAAVWEPIAPPSDPVLMRLIEGEGGVA